LGSLIFHRSEALMTRIFLSLTLTLALVACPGCGGEESNKTTGSSCAADGDCSGGVCFDSKCHSTCTAQADCGESQLCVHGTTASGAAADFCNVAASYSGCQGLEDCEALVAGPCDTIMCDTDSGLCGFTHVEYGTPCHAGEVMGHCKSGVCEVEGGGEDVVSDRDTSFPDASTTQDTAVAEDCARESDLPATTPWTGEGGVAQVTVVFDLESHQVSAFEGFNDAETLTIDRLQEADAIIYQATTAGAWSMLEVSHGEFENMEGWSQWPNLPLDTVIWVRLQNTSGTQVTISFQLNGQGVTVTGACWEDALLGA
jgi:hypothetical protein